jgi:hypothetical protein
VSLCTQPSIKPKSKAHMNSHKFNANNRGAFDTGTNCPKIVCSL